MIQDFDLTARWSTLLHAHFTEAVHNIAQLWPDVQSLEVSYQIIEGFDHDFAQSILSQPELHYDASNRALRELLADVGHGAIHPWVRIVHLPSDQVRTVSQLRSDDIGAMLAIDAVITKISGVRPRMYSATFKCVACEHLITINQPNEQELIQPMECTQIDGGCGMNSRQTRFELLHDRSVLINSQFIELQELPEQVRGGIQPERLACIAEHDLTGKVNPGDRVKANGVLFIRSQRKHGKDTPVFDIFLRMQSLERQNLALEEIVVSDEEEAEIRELASSPDIYDRLSSSIAPSIFGMEKIKETLMLQLFGGVARLNPDGTRNRGDIHILLMGDPGVAKSQLLAYMGKISPRGRFTSGMSASAAGLTAAAVQDSNADGRWTLEAGALVLADQGLAAIDEFDKMNQSDRSSMHEAMEQQRISISKAGINASLRTRCAVLAAANPKAGRFQPVSEVPFTGQINLDPPLISRFDVIWLLTDEPSEDKDAKIAGHIVNNRFSGTSELLVNEGSAPDPTKQSSVVTTPSHTEGHLHREFMRKYIAFSKRSIHPNLDEEARKYIIDYYVGERKKAGDFQDTVAITARSLEALARLTEASARIRLAETASLQDAERAVRLTKTWRYDLMGENFDETAVQSNKKGTARHAERTILDIIARFQQNGGGVAQLLDVINEAERENIPRSKAEEVIEKLNQTGRLMRPNGYDTLQIV
ncbi:minichromosome maintenance protein MCM [Candidatus Poseidoniales archaeon]|nr:minichromosome maintenance protein MCM [Candidatus Poseidoniales archaeon]MDB2542147.1 minichromosome maintenance protein MCM [Candidatus Poseidoniales archaeon]MDC0285582.1 minichromosome maintenance protein MCM [Candidatus Poseidoniaceae archaeon]MDC3316775.1 minichromosome maintenance protein MCM [Candidatus Poseidoniaceae archaeon]|tara:strand:+ start:224 stop:2338 length:2115 start_codon:yes stop_codon:yes gene_type:complete